MGLVVTQEGAAALWSAVLGLRPLGILNLHLVGNPHTASPRDTYGSYAADELVVPGYTPKALINPGVDWLIAPVPLGAQAAYIPVQWSFGAACRVYAYWFADQANMLAIAGETFATPFITNAPGLFTLQLPPTLTS